MSKIKKHITTSYETTDGKGFKRKKEAEVWQNVIDQIENIKMLTIKFEKTNSVSDTIYLKIENEDQLVVYNNLSKTEGYDSTNDIVLKPGYYKYDGDRYFSIDEKINELMELKNKIDSAS